MTPIKYSILQGENLTSVLVNSNVPVDIHTAFEIGCPGLAASGISKVSYTSPKSGKRIFALQLERGVAQDDVICHAWQFEQDFTASEAMVFVATHFTK